MSFHLSYPLSGGRILPFAEQRPEYVIVQRYRSTSSSGCGETTCQCLRGCRVDRTQEAIVASDVEKGVEERQAADPRFVVD